ncbi:MAG: hypothetical protein AAF236_15670 [Verrucomicrobiota bacterium]
MKPIRLVAILLIFVGSISGLGLHHSALTVAVLPSLEVLDDVPGVEPLSRVQPIRRGEAKRNSEGAWETEVEVHDFEASTGRFPLYVIAIGLVLAGWSAALLVRSFGGNRSPRRWGLVAGLLLLLTALANAHGFFGMMAAFDLLRFSGGSSPSDLTENCGLALRSIRWGWFFAVAAGVFWVFGELRRRQQGRSKRVSARVASVLSVGLILLAGVIGIWGVLFLLQEPLETGWGDTRVSGYLRFSVFSCLAASLAALVGVVSVCLDREKRQAEQ